MYVYKQTANKQTYLKLCFELRTFISNGRIFTEQVIFVLCIALFTKAFLKFGLNKLIFSKEFPLIQADETHANDINHLVLDIVWNLKSQKTFFKTLKYMLRAKI